MRIVVNGETRELPKPVSVTALLDELGLPREVVAVELNRRILPRAEFDGTRLGEGDEIEIAHFVGGG